ncbi:hypothetical protein [Acidithiobacillus ferrianus]|uniref:hypothetical protein n=1 Tax=Acidithiobacillus ferrianus TaxID=2678518 RepID=UPI0034E38C37
MSDIVEPVPMAAEEVVLLAVSEGVEAAEALEALPLLAGAVVASFFAQAAANKTTPAITATRIICDRLGFTNSIFVLLC